MHQLYTEWLATSVTVTSILVEHTLLIWPRVHSIVTKLVSLTIRSTSVPQYNRLFLVTLASEQLPYCLPHHFLMFQNKKKSTASIFATRFASAFSFALHNKSQICCYQMHFTTLKCAKMYYNRSILYYSTSRSSSSIGLCRPIQLCSMCLALGYVSACIGLYAAPQFMRRRADTA